jgi:hypothetical protein
VCGSGRHASASSTLLPSRRLSDKAKIRQSAEMPATQPILPCWRRTLRDERRVSIANPTPKESIILKHLLNRAAKTKRPPSFRFSTRVTWLPLQLGNNAHRSEIRVLSPLFPHFASILQYQFRIQPVRTTGTSSLAGNPISAIVHAGRLVASRVWLRLE